jgi:hypothetical protein
MIDFLQNLNGKYKIELPGTRFELASLRLTVFCVCQFRHPGINKIHNSSIKQIVSAQRRSIFIFQFHL